MKLRDVSGDKARQSVKAKILIGYVILIVSGVFILMVPEGKIQFFGFIGFWVGVFWLGTAYLMKYWYYE